MPKTTRNQSFKRLRQNVTNSSSYIPRRLVRCNGQQVFVSKVLCSKLGRMVVPPLCGSSSFATGFGVKILAPFCGRYHDTVLLGQAGMCCTTWFAIVNWRLEHNLTPCEQDATWSLIPKSTVHSSNGILPLFVEFVPILQWSMASFAAPHPICVFRLFSMVKLQGQTPPWGIPPNRKTSWRTYVWF